MPCQTVAGKFFFWFYWCAFKTVLRLLCKRLSKLIKLTLLKTLFRGWFLKLSYIQINICMTVSLWELQSDLSLKDASEVVQKESHEAV